MLRFRARRRAPAATSARAGLYAYSLITRATQEGGGAPGFLVHRLVQDFARRAMAEERRPQALREALEWVNAAFVGAPEDVRNWPILDPLAPHALAVARRADEAEIAEPTARLFNHLGGLFDAKADYAEAEPLYSRALAIGEKSYGPDHPNVAIRLNNLAALLQATNRLAEAEPLYRRALAIDEKSYGPDHPNVAINLNNLAQVLQDTNRLAEAEPLMRRALAIDEKSYGPDHPDVATHLNNLALLLQDTNRLAEAEPLYRRALAIDEKSLRPGSSRCGDRPQQSRDAASGHEPPRRSRAADAPRARDRRKQLRPRSSQRGDPPQQSRAAASGHEPPRRGRAADTPRARDRREEPRAGSSQRGDRDLNNLAQLLQATNRLAEAEPLVRRALAIVEASLGPDHPNTMKVRNNLAGLRAALGKGG